MNPVAFEESNVTLGAPPGMEKEVGKLEVFTDGQQCVSCWRPSLRERLSILLFGRVWLFVLAGRTQPPVSVVGRRNNFGEPIQLKWLLKQLMPLKYESTYTVNAPDGDYKERCTWRMWMGRCFSIQRTII